MKKSNKNLLTLSTQQTPLVCRIFSVRERSLLCGEEKMYAGKVRYYSYLFIRNENGPIASLFINFSTKTGMLATPLFN